MTTRPSNATLARRSVSALNSILLLVIWRKYGKRAFALAYLAAFAQGVYSAWPQLEALWNARQQQKIADDLSDDLIDIESLVGLESLFTRLSGGDPSDPLQRLFIKPKDTE